MLETEAQLNLKLYESSKAKCKNFSQLYCKRDEMNRLNRDDSNTAKANHPGEEFFFGPYRPTVLYSRIGCSWLSANTHKSDTMLRITFHGYSSPAVRSILGILSEYMIIDFLHYRCSYEEDLTRQGIMMIDDRRHIKDILVKMFIKSPPT